MSVVEVILRMKDQASGTLKGVSTQASQAAKQTQLLEKGMGALNAVVTAEAIKSFVAFYKSLHEARTELIAIAAETGRTVRQVETLSKAAELSGMSIKDYGKAFDALKDKPELLQDIENHMRALGGTTSKEAVERTEKWNFAIAELKTVFMGMFDYLEGAFGGAGQLIQNFTLGMVAAGTFLNTFFRSVSTGIIREFNETKAYFDDFKKFANTNPDAPLSEFFLQRKLRGISSERGGFGTGPAGNISIDNVFAQAWEQAEAMMMEFSKRLLESRDAAKAAAEEIKKVVTGLDDAAASSKEASGSLPNVKPNTTPVNPGTPGIAGGSAPATDDGVNRGALANGVEQVSVAIQGGLTTILRMAGGWVGQIIAAIIEIVKVLPDLQEGINAEIEAIFRNLPKIFGESGAESIIEGTALFDVIPEIVGEIIAAFPKFTEMLIQAFPKAFISVMSSVPKIVIEVVKGIAMLIPTLVNDFIPAIIQAGKELMNELGKMLEQLAKDLGIAPDPDKLKQGGKEGAGEGAKIGAIIGAFLGVPMLGAGIGAIAGSQGNRSHGYNYRENYTHFATGGFSTKTGWAYLHEGERIVPPTGASTSTAEANWARTGVSPAGGPTIVNNFNGPVYGGDEGLRQLIRHIRVGMRRMNESLS